MSLASHIKNLGKIAPVGLEDWVGVEEQQLQARPRKRAETLQEDRLGVDGDQVRTKAPQGEDKIAAEDGNNVGIPTAVLLTNSPGIYDDVERNEVLVACLAFLSTAIWKSVSFPKQLLLHCSSGTGTVDN